MEEHKSDITNQISEPIHPISVEVPNLIKEVVVPDPIPRLRRDIQNANEWSVLAVIMWLLTVIVVFVILIDIERRIGNLRMPQPPPVVLPFQLQPVAPMPQPAQHRGFRRFDAQEQFARPPNAVLVCQPITVPVAMPLFQFNHAIVRNDVLFPHFVHRPVHITVRNRVR